MFYFRINKIKVNNNHVTDLWIFNEDVADVKVISFVTTENYDIPNMDRLINENDPVKKKEIIKETVKNVAASRILTNISDVRDNHKLTFGDTGYVLFQSDDIPENFNWNLLMIKDDKNVRDIGETLEDVVNDDEFDKFSNSLLVAIGRAANPTYTAAIGIGKFITKIVGKKMKENKDDIIGNLYMSLNRKEHYPHGKRDIDDVEDLTRNLLVDYSIFAYEEK